MARPSRFVIASYWARKEPAFVIDVGEPACFACGYFEEKWDTPESERQRWEKSALERAHILSERVGGESDPANFVLLCHRCHVDAPMTNDRDILLDWVRRREDWMVTLFKEFSSSCARHGISEKDIEELHGCAPSQQFRDYLRHRRYEKHPHALHTSTDSMAVMLKEFLQLRRLFHTNPKD